MKSEKKSAMKAPSPLRRALQKWTPLFLLVVIGAGWAATHWLGTSRRPSSPAAPVTSTTAPPVLAVTPTEIFSSNLNASVLPGPTNDALHLMNAGNKRLEQDDVEGAIDFYLKALKLNPEDEEVHFNLGFAFGKQGKYNEAIRYYTEALRIFPDYAEAHNNLGNVLRSLRRYEEAATHFSAAIRINPDSDSALNNLGRCLAEMGRTSDAIVQFGEAVRLNPNYLEALFNLGNAQLILGNTEKATQAFSQALKVNPAFSPAAKGLERARQQAASARPR